MIITSIVKQKRNDERYNIYIDNNFTFSADIEDIIKYDIKEGVKLDQNSLDFLIENCEGTKAYNYCLKLLGRRDYTETELRRKLEQKYYSNKTIEKVLEKLKIYDIINDDRYIKKYINNSQRFKKHGKKKILFNLGNKGIPGEMLQMINIDENTEYENAYNLALKKLNLVKEKPDRIERICRYLISKGYEYGLVKRVLNEILSNSESDDI
ncbi:regulatory protein RecX [Fonticella tunisiensis]|uniref:regulatory protein RecX n=1 Tax=Fonticella tunisiensis TaxID=1096341 RepID=UPI001A9B4F8D|nr:regulatory protein RecX [Fonticella tunisiensis]